MVQCGENSGLSLLVSWVQSLVGERRSCKPHSVTSNTHTYKYIYNECPLIFMTSLPHLPTISTVVFLPPGNDPIAAPLKDHCSLLVLMVPVGLHPKTILSFPASCPRLFYPSLTGIWPSQIALTPLHLGLCSAKNITFFLCHLLKILLIPPGPVQVLPPLGNLFI